VRGLGGWGETYGSAGDGGKRQVRVSGYCITGLAPLSHGCLMFTRVGMADKRARCLSFNGSYDIIVISFVTDTNGPVATYLSVRLRNTSNQTSIPHLFC
jgi:hypothetical protein